MFNITSNEGMTIQDFRKVVEELRSQDLPDAVTDFKSLRDFRDEVKKSIKEIDDLYRAAIEEHMTPMFKDKKLSSITVNGYRYTLSETTRASMVAGRKQEALDWLRNNNLQDIIQETVNSSTLSATAKQLIIDGFELDSDFFHVFFQPNVSITKA